ncbi:MAG: efflux RND transporter periplasmic adaptor subunit [Rubellimicrobium sp.]|nr:efflux RND transporter periplasmic adaptor subunit [Rubellimicrobium sp.]
MIRQLFVSLVVLGLAGAAWLYLVPGAPGVLARAGIELPFGPAPQEERATGTPGGAAGSFGRGRVSNVVTAPVVMARINDTLTTIGEGAPARSVTVTATSAGMLTEVLVRPGQRVAAGDVIARFDAEAETIDRDRAGLAADNAAATLRRTRDLAQSNVVAGSALSDAELADSNARLALRTAELALDRRTVTSPIAGTVGLIQVTPGNHVAAQAAITTVDDTASILVDFWVPERYATQLAPGMEVDVSAIALPGQVFRGRVTVIDSRIDATSRTLLVQADIPNGDGALRAGMSLAVTLAFPGETYPAVNPLAILWSGEGSYVWKVADGHATRVMAEIVQRNSDGVLVRADLAPGDAIITEGLLQLSEGQAVNVLDGPGGADASGAEG